MGIKVKQRDITDCGAACLASIAAHYRLMIPVARIRQYAGTDKKGTNILGMNEAAKKMGFEAKGVRGPAESLSQIPLPAIAHILVRNTLQHFIVIYKIQKDRIQIMDPGTGSLEYQKLEEFKKQWTGVLILLSPSSSFKAKNESHSISGRFWQLIKPQKHILGQALFGALIYTILGLASSIFVQKLIDNVLPDANKNLLNLMGIVMIALLIFQLFIGATKSVFTLRSGQIIDSRLILEYYKHLLKLPQQFFDTMRVGEVMSRINDAVKIRLFINDVSINFILNIFIVICSFAMMFTYYWRLALIMLISIPLYLLLYQIANRINKKVQRTLMEQSADFESHLVESLQSVATIKQYGIEEQSHTRTDIRFTALLKSVYTSGVNNVFFGCSSEAISKVFTIILLWVGAGFVLDSYLTAGELLSFYTLIGYFTSPISSLIGMNKTIQDAVIAADRLFEILDLELEDETNKLKLTPDMIGTIVFENVDFRYCSRTAVFKELNLSIPVGKFTAVVGESGSGKSTLITLLQKLYPITNGHIRLGQYDISHVDSNSLRSFIGVVPQKVELFAGSIVENIALGDYDPNIQRIIAICKDLGFSEFIDSLPNGYGTHIGENGVSLSGGQRQRLAIARALYRDPQILLFDEATSALDAYSECYVQSIIQKQLTLGKTIVVIAHRISTIVNADKIIVLEKGLVKEEGLHEELLRKHGSYYDLCKQQSSVFIMSDLEKTLAV